MLTIITGIYSNVTCNVTPAHNLSNNQHSTIIFINIASIIFVTKSSQEIRLLASFWLEPDLKKRSGDWICQSRIQCIRSLEP
jgi:hypothetical protein